jgi:hypothetical protein
MVSGMPAQPLTQDTHWLILGSPWVWRFHLQFFCFLLFCFYFLLIYSGPFILCCSTNIWIKILSSSSLSIFSTIIFSSFFCWIFYKHSVSGLDELKHICFLHLSDVFNKIPTIHFWAQIHSREFFYCVLKHWVGTVFNWGLGNHKQQLFSMYF